MKVATWNVNGIRARQTQFLDWIREEQPDVVCLQEIKAGREQLAADLCELGGYTCYWHGAGGQSGVGLHVNCETVGTAPVFSHPTFDRETRVVEAMIGDVCIASIYVPNGGHKDYEGKLEFLKQMREYTERRLQDTDKLILCGDMNVTRTDQDLHPKERNARLAGQRADERELFEAILDQGLIDLTRHLHPDDDSIFSWWAPWRDHRKKNQGWRIDYQLVSRAVAERASACWVQPEIGTSDHAPVVSELDV